ncbi:MAG: universal stress protein [Bacteroidales bacterium]|nr:universal stress protein [Bacteroidales bacterium]
MFPTLITLVDGSPRAERAIPWALALTPSSGTITLVHVHVSPAPLVMEGVVVTDPTLDETLRLSENEYLTGLLARAAAAAPSLRVTGLNLETDEMLGDAVVHAIQEHNAELVVMSTQGHGPWSRLLLGSVTDETVRHSPVPVLVVRSPDGESPTLTPTDWTQRPTLRHVVVPLDGTPFAEAILPAAVRLARAFSADLGLLAVVEPSQDREAAYGQSGANAEAYLQHMAARLQGQEGVTPLKIIRVGHPADVIVSMAKELGTGEPGTTAVALATHGRAGLSRWLHGSVADAVVRFAPGPVLVYHPTAG